VLTGAVDDVGSFIRATSGKSYRLGLEIDAVLKPTSKLFFQPNIALSSNKNVDFYATINETLVNLGNTNLSFSPEVVFGNTISYLPAKNLQLALLTKYVGKQHMGNLEEAVSTNDVLKSYFVNDLNITYTLKSVKVFESITLNALINNIFNEKYISNGYYGTYDWDGITYDYAGYYPQATTNFLIGISLKF
jgi:iron complex outermembrane receptor protein